MEKLVPDPFIEIQNWAHVWINRLKCYKICFFLVCPSRGIPKKKLKLRCWPLAFTLPYLKLFWKAKRGLELVSIPHFLLDFWRKLFLTLHFVNWPNFIASWLPWLLEILGNMCIVIRCWPVCDVINVEVNH